METSTASIHQSGVSQTTRSPQHIMYGIRKRIIELRIWIHIVGLVFRIFNNPFKVWSILKLMDARRREYLGPGNVKKLVKVNGRYFYDLYTPGWPSPVFDKSMIGEISRIEPIGKQSNRFTNIFVAITKKCSLQCEHCFEWNALNGPEKLTLNDLREITAKFQRLGTGQIQLTGGEPMLRIHDIPELIGSAHQSSDFWILTSGLNLTEQHARLLKSSGLTGVVISLDHHDEDLHNRFRGYKQSYEWAQRAVKNATEAELVTALSICATRAFISEENLMAYADLALQWGVSFVQILEPKAVGHYNGQDVLLNETQLKFLEKFTLKMNYDPRFRHYPIFIYHGYYQRRNGCFAAGNRSLYVDTDGDIHACPFCHAKMGNALSPKIPPIVSEVLTKGCMTYGTNPN